ncbi:hypothetical protein BGZ47_008177 [Haplosporangium gracile]|nr:hypothetical protein BGZ47_008177 [Haplosporangium gracile]
MPESEDFDGQDRIQRPGSDAEYEEYFLLPGEYDPGHPKGYQQQQQPNSDDRSEEERGRSVNLDIEQRSRKEKPNFWIAPSRPSSQSSSPLRSALLSFSYFPSLALHTRDGGEQKDGIGYVGDSDNSSAEDDIDNDNDEDIIAVMPHFASMPSVFSDSNDNHSTSTQYLPPMSTTLYNSNNNNNVDEDEDGNNTTTVVDDRSPSKKATITITTYNDGDSTERRSITENMAI